MVQYRQFWAEDTTAAIASSWTRVREDAPNVMLTLLLLTASIAAGLMDITLIIGGFWSSVSLIHDMVISFFALNPALPPKLADP